MASEDLSSWEDVRAWRKTMRAELVQRREAVAEDERKAWNERITAHLVAAFEMPEDAVVGLCWPYKGEFDARFAARAWRERGAVAALPEVVAPKTPLQFRKWWPGAPMRPGVYDIPVPEGTEIVLPDIAIVPMNAFDARGFRLGYGGGFFDRTLAACERRMIAIGVSYDVLGVETIYPQAHDVPMDFVVTESGVRGIGGAPLQRLDDAAAGDAFRRLLIERRLPRESYREGGLASPVCYADQFPGYFGEKDCDK